tara:strand:+ start:1198 stop:1431 length:234 start_codon:yes stop_codon:yes gene_type:complete
MSRELFEIAQEIKSDWGAKVNYGAVPYLDAMASLRTVDDMFINDTADSVVRYFLSNARFWRGEVAKRVKKELNEMLN